MSDDIQWLKNLGDSANAAPVDGLVQVSGYMPYGRPPEEVAIMKKAENYGADAVFFEAGQGGHSDIAQAFVYVSDGPADDPAFGALHKRLWSWGGVPLVYRKTDGLIQLFRCAHKPDFINANGETICNAHETLDIATGIASDPWWNAQQLRNGALWNDPAVCEHLLSARYSAHKQLIDAFKILNNNLNENMLFSKRLRRKLLILSLLIAYLEARSVLLPDYFMRFHKGATRFFEILSEGQALINLLADLEERFNGNVFTLKPEDSLALIGNPDLARFAELIEARTERSRQLTLWERYSFKDLPVELISHIYQIFVTDTDSSIYTPHFLVRLILDETLSMARLDRLHEKGEIILDPACGSGIFLVEAYKRIVLHWRYRNDWKQPSVKVLKDLLQKVHGIDLDEGAVELAAFSLCLALCDALEPETIRKTIKLFPDLAGNTLHCACFFEAVEQNLVKVPIGVVTGNPPFTSSLTTPGAERSYQHYQATYDLLPDKQLGYLFLHGAMEMLTEGGVLGMLQHYGFLYNQKSLAFRRQFLARWDVRELLDFISVRGLFQKGDADTKVVVVLAEHKSPPTDRKILHATFRRSGRADAEQGFDIDYYDMHWLPRDLALSNDHVWRSDLLTGGRVLALVDRLKQFRSVGQYAESKSWDRGEGFIIGNKGKLHEGPHLTGKELIPPAAISAKGVDRTKFSKVDARLFKTPYTPARFMPPMVLIREHMDLAHALWTESYLTYKNEVVGICAKPDDLPELEHLYYWLGSNQKALKAFTAATSTRMFTQKATIISELDVLSIPYPESYTLDLSVNEQIIVDDIADYFCDLVRLGDGSEAMKQDGRDALPEFGKVFASQINAIYNENTLHPLPPQMWPGAICQAFAFGKSQVNWEGVDELKDRLDALLCEQQGVALHVTRIARIYDQNFIFLLKPDRLRYWLRSIALRDADETLSDLRSQGF